MNLTDEELNYVSSLVQEQLRLEREVADLEAKLKSVSEQLTEVQTRRLPEAMSELFIDELKMSNGCMIIIKDHYYASIKEENKSEAFRWLEKHNYDGIIKNVVKCEFGKGDNEDAKKAMHELSSLGFHPSQQQSVHPMTLKSFVKDLFERGEEFPMETFGAGVVKKATIKVPK